MRRAGEIVPISRKPRLYLANGLWWCVGIKPGGWLRGPSPYSVQGETPYYAYKNWISA